MIRTLFQTTFASIVMLAAIPGLAQDQESGDAYLENPNYNLGGTGNIVYGNSYSVGNNFQVVAADVPAGDSIYITALGYYAGTPGEFTGGGTVTANQTLALFGPSSTHTGNLSGENLAEVTLDAGATADANGFAWAQLTTPVQLTAGDYYDLLTTEGGSEAYLSPYDSGSTGNAAMTLTPGSPFAIYEGAYASSITASEGYAYSDSTYLGPDMQYEIEGPTPVPEPAIMALMACGLVTSMGFRRRCS